MSKIKKYFIPTNPMVKRLLSWKQGDQQEKWATKAIETLIKKLRTRKSSLDNLEYALNNPNCPSKCVLLSKNLDGRVQVMHRKEQPHVIYCRIWRWSDLVSHHELKSTDMCENPYSIKSSEICVNPYHYRRLGYPSLPPVLVPSQPQHQPAQLPTQLRPVEPRLPCNVSYGTDGFLIPDNYNNAFKNYHAQSQVYNNNLTSYNTATENTNITFPNYNHGIGNGMIGRENNNGAQNINFGSEFYNQNNVNKSGYFNTGNGNYNTQPNFYNVEPKNFNPVSSGQLEQFNAPSQTSMDLHSLNSSPESLSPESLSPVYSLDNCYDFENLLSTELASMQTKNSSDTIAFTPINYSTPKYWASIAYYELNTRVGEMYHCEPISVVVDGYTNPHWNSNRFCLGKLSNVKRNTTIENTRRHIGKGLGLNYLNGELIAECLSDAAVFTQSQNCNRLNGFHPSTVCKIQPGCNLKIFSSEYFAQLLNESIQYGFDAVYELTKMCTIRMSFVKGWGAEYQRQDVTSTPCWIEIHLNGPLQWLDRVLNQMGPSVYRISSVS